MKPKKLLSFLIACVMMLSILPSNIVFAKKEDTSYSRNAQSIDDIYVYNEYDLGATYSADSTTFNVWAPTATAVKLNLYATGTDSEDGAAGLGSDNLVELKDYNSEFTGVWTITLIGDYKNYYYTYSITNESGTTNEVRDIYSKAVGADGLRSMVTDLDATDPANWDEDSHIFTDKLTDSIIYKIGIKDFTSQSDSGISESNRGSYLAFTENGTTYKNEGEVSTGIEYLKELGITTVQLDLFACDDIYDKDAGYTSNPYDGNIRIREQKQMIKALHDAGLSVVTEVPFAYDNGVGDIFENTVEKYYLRRDKNGDFSYDSGMRKDGDSKYGRNFASERAMYRNYIIQMLLYYANEYHIDGFCFNRSGNLDTETFNMARDALDEIDSRITLYGDGAGDGGTYPMTTCIGETLYLANNATTAILYNRVAVYDSYHNEALSEMFKGTRSFIYFTGDLTKRPPLKSIRCYTTDGNLYEKIVRTSKIAPNGERNDEVVKLSKMAIALTGTFPGATMINSGDEVYRSNAEYFDWKNIVDYADILSYYRGIVQIKKAFSPCSTTDNNFENLFTYIKSGSARSGYILKNETAGEWENLMIIPNNTTSDMTLTLPDEVDITEWVIIANGETAGVKSLGEISGREVTVSPQTTLIAVDKASFDSTDIQSKVDFGNVNISYVSEEDSSPVCTGVALQGKVGTEYKVSDNIIDSKMPKCYDIVSIDGELSGEYTKATIDIVVKLRENHIGDCTKDKCECGQDRDAHQSHTWSEWTYDVAKGRNSRHCINEGCNIIEYESDVDNINLGAAALSGYDSENGYSYIYYGTYEGDPIKWRVLDTTYKYDKTDLSKTGMLLLSEYVLGKTVFGENETWKGSTVQSWCADMFDSSFGADEQKHIWKTNSDDILDNDRLFFLSKGEVENEVYFPNYYTRITTNLSDEIFYYFLRTPYGYHLVCITTANGLTDACSAIYPTEVGIRPAFNLKQSEILFTSAEGVKPIDIGNIKKNENYGLRKNRKYEYKLTMLDESRKFTVTEKSAKGTKGESITLNYDKAKPGSNEHISAMIVKDGEVLYYGQGETTDTLSNNDDPETEKGKVNFTLPNDIAYGEYKLYVFNEQINGDKETDFSSDFQRVTLNVKGIPAISDFTFNEPSNSTYDGNAKSATVTSDKSGMGEITVKYYDESENPLSSAPTNAGTYKVKIDVAEGTNYNAANDLTADNWKFTIEKATPTVSAPKAKTGLVYDGTEQALVTAGETNDGTVKYSLSENGTYSENIPTAKNADTYTVWYYIEGNDSHSDSDKSSVEVTISQKEITTDTATITLGDSLTYNGAEQTQTVTKVEVDGLTLTENTDYTISNNTGTEAKTDYVLTITGKGNFTGTATTQFSIAKAGSQTTVTPNNTSITYGDTLTLTAEVEKNSKSKTVAKEPDKVVFYLAGTEDVLGEVIVAYDDDTKKDKGTATLKLEVADANYKKLKICSNKITADYGGSVNLNNSGSNAIIVTLNPKDVGLSWSGYENLVYDGNAKSVTATTNDFVDDNDVSLNITGGDKINAGTYTATASLNGKNAEYYTLKTEDATKEYTIDPKTVEATISDIDDQTYTGSEIKPAITAYDGTTVIPTSEYTVGYSNNENAGTATVTITNNTGGNYTVSGSTRFEILPKSINSATVGTFAAMTYNGTEQTPSATVTIGGLTATGVWSDVKNVSDKTTFTADGNFTGEISNQSTGMKPLPVEISWTGTEGLVFDNNEKTISAEVSNIKGDDVVNLTIDGDLTGTSKGTYTAIVTAVNNENYTIENGQNLEKEWVISQANDNVITNLAINGWTYGDTENTPTATAKYGTPSFTYSTEENGGYIATVPTNAGTYWVKATVAGTEDYAEVSSEPISFTIAKAESSVTTEPTKAENLVYTGEELTLLTADGTVTGGTIKYSINGTDFTYDFADIPKVINAKDDYKVWYKVVGDKNHNDTAPVCIEIKVAKKPINTAITLTAPVKYATPETSIDTDEYTATVVWSPTVEVNGTFAKNTEYTATITVTPKANYTTVGIAENGYTLDGATSITNVADSNVITAVFPKTAGSSGGGGTSRYTVKFDTDGGNTITNQTVTKNSKATEPTTPTKEGYVFDGWYTDSKFTTEYDFDTKITKNITLYAKWVEDEAQNPSDDKKDDKLQTDDWKNPFDDVNDNEWYFDNVKYANENGLMSGTTDTTFAPNDVGLSMMCYTFLKKSRRLQGKL